MADERDDGRAAPGWKRDPWRRFAGRYWDGQQWTQHVVTADSVRAADPVPTTPPPTVAPPPAPEQPAAERTLPMDTVYPPRPGFALPPHSSSDNAAWAAVRAWPRWVHWALGVILALAILGAAFGDTDNDVPLSVVGDQATTLTLPLAETTLPPTTLPPTTTTLATASTTTVAVTTTAPATTTRATNAPDTTRATTGTTAAPTIRQGVTAGAFCSPGGALGVTSTGLDMICTTTATDDRNRWRRA